MPRPKKARQGALYDVQEITDAEKVLELAQAFQKSAMPHKRLYMDEWADKYFMLPSETSSEPGRWRTDRFPFLRKIMRALSPQSISKQITWVKGAQIGGTTICIIKILYSSDMDPGPMMYVRETEDAAKEFSKEKLVPSIAVCSRVKNTLGDNKPYQLANDALNKGFPGGFLTMGSSGSELVLRGKSIRDILADEEDSYPRDVKAGGSPIANLRKRQANFPMSKMFRISTPKIKETSTLWPAFEEGSQEHFYLPCPLCNPNKHRKKALFRIEWYTQETEPGVAIIRWDDERDEITGMPVNIWLECPYCGGQIEEFHKTWMLKHGLWLSNKGNEDPTDLYEVGDIEYPSFRLPSFYSPYGFFSWADAVREFFEWKESRDPAALQVFENQTCALTYSLQNDVSHTTVAQHKEDYFDEETGEIIDVPKSAVCLTSGVDVQQDRIEVEVVGWAPGFESYAIDYAVLRGNTDYLGDENGNDPNTGQPTVWKELDHYLLKRWKHASGINMPVECTCIDSNYRSEQVHAFCLPREKRRIYPIIGKALTTGKGHLQRPKRKTERWNTWQYTLWVDEIKDLMYQFFKLDTNGPGFCHWPNKDCYDEKYFKGLTCEYRKAVIRGGRKHLIWETPKGARNEPLDLRNYAFGALQVYRQDALAFLDQRSKYETPFGARVIRIQNQSKAPRRRARQISKGLEV